MRTMTDCLFCKIVAGEIPADIVHETETTIAFRDINPQAPTHILIIPRKHIATINDLDESDKETVGSLYLAAKEIAAEEGIDEYGDQFGAGAGLFERAPQAALDVALVCDTGQWNRTTRAAMSQ